MAESADARSAMGDAIRESGSVIAALAGCLDTLVAIADRLTACLRAGGTIYLCGNGGSAADAQHVAAEFVGRFLRERRPLPAIALTCNTSILTAIGNDYEFSQVFARQVRAHVTPRDCVVGISTSGKSPNVLEALKAAREAAARPSGRLVAFLCCFMFGAHFAGPYFTPYMLEELGFTYHAYLLVFGTSFLTKALVLPAIGRLASRIGPVGLLGLATLAIAPLSLLWLPSASIGWLVVVQVIAGACWAAYELAVSILLLDAIGDDERTGVVTVYNLALAIATVAGAGCGGLLLRSLGEDRAAYATVFVVSCLLRAAALPLLRRVRLPS